jgi:hypothetical protein
MAKLRISSGVDIIPRSTSISKSVNYVKGHNVSLSGKAKPTLFKPYFYTSLYYVISKIHEAALMAYF